MGAQQYKLFYILFTGSLYICPVGSACPSFNHATFTHVRSFRDRLEAYDGIMRKYRLTDVSGLSADVIAEGDQEPAYVYTPTFRGNSKYLFVKNQDQFARSGADVGKKRAIFTPHSSGEQ